MSRVVRELGLERRETVRFLSTVGKGDPLLLYPLYERTGIWLPMVNRLFDGPSSAGKLRSMGRTARKLEFLVVDQWSRTCRLWNTTSIGEMVYQPVWLIDQLSRTKPTA